MSLNSSSSEPISRPCHYSNSFSDRLAEDELSEQALRELYDNYEIERYLTLFTTYVTEVRAPEEHPSGRQSNREVNANTSSDVSFNTLTELNDTSATSTPDYFHSHYTGSLLGEVVARWLVPMLPPARPASHVFTIGKMRLTVQRLYLAVDPVYIPFFRRMRNLASWKDRKTSFIYCAIFWILWYHDLLLPSLIFRLFYSLICRRIMPYPTLTELKEHEREISRAAEFGDQVSDKLSTSSSLGFKELWRLFRTANNTRKNKSKAPGAAPSKTAKIPDEDSIAQHDDATILDDSEGNQAIKDSKRVVLDALDEIADLHERVKNIFIWRRPASSHLYGTLLFVLFLLTLFVPARFLCKSVYFIGGVSFWHIPPIIATLSPSDRLRIPPAFGDVPTDADYAMELVAHRVATGLEIDRPRMRSSGKHPMRNENLSKSDSVAAENVDPRGKNTQTIDWKKWAQRTVIAKTWVDDGRRLITGNKTSTNVSSNSLTPQATVSTMEPKSIHGNHSYPAQHTSGPGLITLTSSALLFTSLLSLEPQLEISLSNIRGVKKIGFVKGLLINIKLEDGMESEMEEKFRWIGDRDELFARLVGSKGIRLLKT